MVSLAHGGVLDDDTLAAIADRSDKTAARVATGGWLNRTTWSRSPRR
jgi:hypothetical protein